MTKPFSPEELTLRIQKLIELRIPETSSGIYELPFYTMPNQAATITVSNGVDTENFTTTSCSPCPDPIPTLSQWGVLVFGLLILNLSLIFIKSKAHTLD